MAQTGGGDVYATLLLSDSYLPGALVLAHSLRDAGTTKKLAVLVTLDTVSADAITQLQTVYDYIFPVPRIRNEHPANLYLMDRADLHSAFTKIHLWKLTQFSKIVYIDADVVAYRAPDELFRLPHAFSAAPDIGWPDLFNTGVMVLTPSMGEFYAMLAMAERGISFDGADQGLLNMHFKNSYNRLSFTYNVTPSAHYQYLPAYRHFQSSINMVHFIGSNKPWFFSRHASHGNSPYDEMVGRWWAVYDRHYRLHESSQSATHTQQHGGSEYSAAPTQQSWTQQPSGNTSGEYQPQTPARHDYHVPSSSHEHTRGPVSHADNASTTTGAARPEQHVPQQHSFTQPPPEPKEQPQIAMSSWDAQKQPPPANSKPEAINFPGTHYEMSRDTTPFKPPVRYPSPPKDMYYEIPKEPPSPRAHKTRPVFPWEGTQPTASRHFAVDEPGSPLAEEIPPSLPAETPTANTQAEPTTTTTTPNTSTGVSDPWNSFMRSNAWDDVPEINRYVDGLQKHRRVTSIGTSRGASSGVQSPGRLDVGTRKTAKPQGFKLTDFPTAIERPSLPVTPAPIRRPSFWGDEQEQAEQQEEEEQQLPRADGVPGQTEWDPAVQLQKLAKQQSEALLRRLGGDDGEGEGPEGGVSRDIPSRSLPLSSELLRSPTYVAQSPTTVLSPRPVKGEAETIGFVRRISRQEDEGPVPLSSETTATTATSEGTDGLATQ